MTQDELKALVAQAAADYVKQEVPEGAVLGVGTGSTANLFIDAVAAFKERFSGAVSSSRPPHAACNSTVSMCSI
jgi:ribose 5-phosphate isomerase A